MRIIELEQGTPEWRVWRLSGIPASNMAAILPKGHPNKCPYKSTRNLFDLVTGRAEEEDLSRNPNVQRGVRNEPFIRLHAEAQIDDLLVPMCAESESHPYIRASFDGLSTMGIPHEFKSPSDKGWAEVCEIGAESALIRRYMAQVQTQMFVAEADHAWMYFCAPDLSDFRSFRIERDDKLIGELLEAAERFMECVRNDTPPEIDPDMDIVIPRGEALEEWIFQAEEYRIVTAEISSIKEALKALETRADEAEEILVAIANRYYAGWKKTEVAGVALTRSLRKGSIDYPKACKTLGITDDQLEPFRKDGTEVVRVTIKEMEVPKLVADESVIKEVAEAKESSNFYF